MHLWFHNESFANTFDLTMKILDDGIIIADLPNIDLMKASLLCFVENFRTVLHFPDEDPSEYLIHDPFIEYPAQFVRLPKEEQIVLIGWMAFFLEYIDHAVEKEYFLREYVDALYVGGTHISDYLTNLEGYLNTVISLDTSLTEIYDHWCKFYYSI
ncbi:unnamed protein product [Rodentolepis nana]|uniref:DUF2787 domain-containing protein n=1 Tax=Rodentolepis nana TaxID=102285 RepID=A0A0R3T334_RODNA|nr:unnamed protein product [Rodentolepis nana]